MYYNRLLILRTCYRGSLSLEGVQKVHAAVIENGLAATDALVQNALLNMYAMHGRVSVARQVFQRIPRRDVVHWTTLMAGYARNRLPKETLQLFRAMITGLEVQVQPDEVTMLTLFGACSQLGDDITGTLSHCYIIKKGLPLTVAACNAAMDMYVKCGRIGDARCMFEEMKSIPPTVVSWTIILTGALKCEGLSAARKVFDQMPEKNEVSWTVMITGYVEGGCSREAFSLLQQMLSLSSSTDSGVGLNPVTLCSLLSACSQSGDLTMGRWVHLYTVKNTQHHRHRHQMDVMVGTAMVNMYAKVGRIDTAWLVFQRMEQKNVVAWNAMLSGLAMHGRGRAALRLFSELQQAVDVEADDITWVGVLSACSHSGLVEEGRRHFNKFLQTLHGTTPKVEHYACMVDLLGRAGHVEEAERLVREMPVEPNAVVVGSLLASCKLHGKLELGEQLLQQFLQLDPNNAHYHVLLSNMYAPTSRDKANRVREMLKERGINKAPGRSLIQVRGDVHQFTAGDKSHPRSQEIYGMLEEMVRRLRLAGYVPNNSSTVCLLLSSDDTDEPEEKEQALLAHSERLAIAFGLISTPPGLPIRILKNLRMCQDCHAAVKLTSLVFHREIVIRDRNRFHCFKSGSCSCADYW